MAFLFLALILLHLSLRVLLWVNARTLRHFEFHFAAIEIVRKTHMLLHTRKIRKDEL